VWLQAQNEGEDNFTEAMSLAGLRDPLDKPKRQQPVLDALRTKPEKMDEKTFDSVAASLQSNPPDPVQKQEAAT
jgi:hypothetical protein